MSPPHPPPSRYSVALGSPRCPGPWHCVNSCEGAKSPPSSPGGQEAALPLGCGRWSLWVVRGAGGVCWSLGAFGSSGETQTVGFPHAAHLAIRFKPHNPQLPRDTTAASLPFLGGNRVRSSLLSFLALPRIGVKFSLFVLTLTQPPFSHLRLVSCICDMISSTLPMLPFGPCSLICECLLPQALVTGSLPGFVDVIRNLNSPALLEDNVITQAKAAGKRMIFYGDDTWVKLFPKHFVEYDGTTSFFVSDYTEVSFPNKRRARERVQDLAHSVSGRLQRFAWGVCLCAGSNVETP